MSTFIIYIILCLTGSSLCWDNDDLEIFDLVEEINTNFYTLLGIPQDANATSIRKAFRSLSLVLHPDKNSAPDAEEKFRHLVAVYDVLKEPTKREKYDEVLKNGLPNWKSAVYYYRHVRKVGIVELIVILFILISIGQYTIGWASYIEQKFTIESNRKAKEKKLKKANKGKIVAESQQNWIDEIPKPSVLDTLPIQIPRLLWTILINFPSTVTSTVQMFIEMNEERKRKIQLEEEERLAEANKRQEVEEEKPKRRKKVPFVVQERTFEESACLLDPVDIPPVEESRYKPVPITGGFWSDDDFAELARLAKKYPPGSTDRWEKIANIMNRTVAEVSHMASKIKDNPHLFLKSSDEINTAPVEEFPKKIKTKAESKLDAESSNASWSQLQQKALENALTKYPKGSVSDRWDKIAKSVPDKTKEECMQRYRNLVELVNKQKSKDGSDSISEQ